MANTKKRIAQETGQQQEKQGAQAAAGKGKAAGDKPRRFWEQTLPNILNILVMLLSLGLIAFISWCTFKGINYLENSQYMSYQLIVCLFFILEYFYRLFLSRHKFRYFFLALPFLLISIPYLNIIEYFHIGVSHELLIYLCFIPIVRGLAALVMVVAFIAKRMVTTVAVSYILVVIPTVYMCALIFYIAEKDINTGIVNFWYALWWAGMNITTIGCDINPMTGTGMILSFFLSLLGIVMLPLFTVYTSDLFNMFTSKENSSRKN